MKQEFFGTAICMGDPIRYYLLMAAGSYGVGVEYRSERALLMGLTTKRSEANALLKAMLRGAVTPVTARDVAEDWLKEQKSDTTCNLQTDSV